MSLASLNGLKDDKAERQAGLIIGSHTFFRLFQIGVLLRIGLGPQVLNLFVNYSDSTGGLIFFKIHPGSYMIIGLGMIAAPQVVRYSQIRRNPLALGTLLLLVTPFIMAVWSSFHGQSIGLGFLVDSALTGPFAVFCIAMLTPEQRFLVCRSVVYFFAINAVIVLIEFVTRFRFTPYPYREATFRPSGLLGHPLSTGTLHVTTIPALFLLPFRNSVRWGLTVLLALSVIASQARFGTVVCIVLVGIMFLAQLRQDALNSQRGTTKVGFILTLVLMTVPIGVAILLQQGFFDRLLTGFNDESTASRIVVYDLFHYMSWDQIYYGMDIERAMFYVRKGLKIDYIESVIVLFVINFGAIAGAFFLTAIVLYAVGLGWDAPWQAKLMLTAYMILILSNNGLAGKGPTFVYMALFSFGAATCAAVAPTDRRAGGQSRRL